MRPKLIFITKTLLLLILILNNITNSSISLISIKSIKNLRSNQNGCRNLSEQQKLVTQSSYKILLKMQERKLSIIKILIALSFKLSQAAHLSRKVKQPSVFIFCRCLELTWMQKILKMVRRLWWLHVRRDTLKLWIFYYSMKYRLI